MLRTQAAILPEGTEEMIGNHWAVGLSSEASLDGQSYVYAALAQAWWWMLDYLPATGAAGNTTMVRALPQCKPCI